MQLSVWNLERTLSAIRGGHLTFEGGGSGGFGIGVNF